MTNSGNFIFLKTGHIKVEWGVVKNKIDKLGGKNDKLEKKLTNCSLQQFYTLFFKYRIKSVDH